MINRYFRKNLPSIAEVVDNLACLLCDASVSTEIPLFSRTSATLSYP